MKHILKLAVCLSAMSPMPALAQTHYESKIEIGGHVGANLSMVSFTPGITQGLLPGANGGINFRYMEENHFGFIVELNFEQRGWKEDFEKRPFSYSRTVNYLQLPFLAHIYFGRRGRFFINAGPSVSLALGESTNSNFDYTDIGSVEGFPNRMIYQYGMPVENKFDYGISGGIGGEFRINRRNSLYLEARYYFGLGNMLRSGRTEHFRGSNPMSISVAAGYWFRVK